MKRYLLPVLFLVLGIKAASGEAFVHPGILHTREDLARIKSFVDKQVQPVVSDSEAVEFLSDKHHVSETYEDAVALCVNAGLNIRTTFRTPESFILPLRDAIAHGKISMEALDRRVEDILRVKFWLGLFNNPYRGDGDEALRRVHSPQHQAVSLRTAKVADVVSSVTTYAQVLRGFERIHLEPGETQTVTFTLTPQDLGLWDADMHFTVEPGRFDVRIGASSRDIRLQGSFQIR